MNFDVYIVGGMSFQTLHGLAHATDRKLVADNVTYPKLKGKVKEVLHSLQRNKYNTNGYAYEAYEVYPHGATSNQFPAYNLLTDDIVPLYNEFQTVRNNTGNFDTHQRWKRK